MLTYKFDQAVREGVVLDLRYEARDIDQKLTNKAKIDQWFEAKTKGLNDLARAQLKQKWGTMQRDKERAGKFSLASPFSFRGKLSPTLPPSTGRQSGVSVDSRQSPFALAKRTGPGPFLLKLDRRGHAALQD